MEISIHHLDLSVVCPYHMQESSVTNYVKANPLTV